jgi:hypothetical protein
MGLGTTDLPLASAEIVSIVPSYTYPHKIANIGPMVGELTQDRFNAVGGILGRIPEMASYEIIRRHQAQNPTVLKGSLVKDPNLTPMLIGLLTFIGSQDEENSSQDMTIYMNGSVHFKGLPDLHLTTAFSGSQGEKTMALLGFVQPVQELFQAFPKQLEIESLKLEAQTFENQDTWQIQRVFVPEKSLTDRDRSVHVTVALKNLYGQQREVVFEIPIPEEIKKGPFKIVVSGGAELKEREPQNWKASPVSWKPQEAIKRLDRYYNDRCVYARLVTDGIGFSVGAENQPLLPPSVTSTLTGNGNRGYLEPLNEKIWSEQSTEVSAIVSGYTEETLNRR